MLYYIYLNRSSQCQTLEIGAWMAMKWRCS